MVPTRLEHKQQLVGRFVVSNPVDWLATLIKRTLSPGTGNDGFGCVEIGTVTPLPPGEMKTRLFRPPDRALINRMGFNNDGAEAVAARLKSMAAKAQRV